MRGQSLRELIEGPLTRDDMRFTIADFRDNNDWKWESLSFVLPPSIKEKIQAIPFQDYGSREDMLLWKFTKDGDFSSNSAYVSILADSGEINTFKGAWIWKVDSLPKIISFLWLCMHKSVPVRDVLADRSIVCSRLCPVCRNQVESIDHLLRECVFARLFWSKMGVISFIHGQAHSRVLKIGSMRTVLASGPSRIIFRGVLFFLLPFGIFGNIETKLYLIMLPLISIYTATVLPKLWIFSIVLAL